MAQHVVSPSPTTTSSSVKESVDTTSGHFSAEGEVPGLAEDRAQLARLEGLLALGDVGPQGLRVSLDGVLQRQLALQLQHSVKAG